MRKIVLMLLLALCGAGLSARSTVDTVRIQVNLQEDGAAIITEEWNIDVSDDITEWYLVADNLGQMRISGLGVTDETGRLF